MHSSPQQNLKTNAFFLLWGGLQVTVLCILSYVCIYVFFYMSNPACITFTFMLLVRRFITAGFVANVLVSWFFSILWRFSRKTLEWNSFVSWVTSFPSLSFCPCVPKHDALFIYFLTQIQLVVFEKFIRQRELCAMILQERNFLIILSLANVLGGNVIFIYIYCYISDASRIWAFKVAR